MKGQTMFWGFLLIGLGILLLVQTILKIDLPIARVLFGLAIVFFGVKLVFGSFNIKMDGLRFEKVVTANKIVFGDGDLSLRGDNSGKLNRDFSTVFGDSKIDLSSLSVDDIDKEFEISTVFGKTEVTTPRDIPLMVVTNSAFGSVNVRGDKTVALGNGLFTTPNFSKDKPHLKIEANSVFGSIEIH